MVIKGYLYAGGVDDGGFCLVEGALELSRQLEAPLLAALQQHMTEPLLAHAVLHYYTAVSAALPHCGQCCTITLRSVLHYHTSADILSSSGQAVRSGCLHTTALITFQDIAGNLQILAVTPITCSALFLDSHKSEL